MKECDKAAKEKYEKILNKMILMTWKVIASVSGGCECSHAYHYGYTRTLKQCWEGKSGELYFGDITSKSLVMERYVIEGMKKLPVREVIGTLHWLGTLEAVYGVNVGGKIQ